MFQQRRSSQEILKPITLARMHKDAKSLTILPIKPSNINLFNKIELITESCDKFKKEINKECEKVSKKIKSNSKRTKKFSVTGEEEDSSWKDMFKSYQQAKIKENKMFEKLKSLSSHQLVVKEPIKRQQAKNDISVPERARISISDIISGTGKKVLSKSKRKFGEIVSGEFNAKQNNRKNEKEIECERNQNSDRQINQKIFRSYEKVKIFPSLALKMYGIRNRK